VDCGALSGQVNAHAPRVLGDGVIHISQFDAVVKADAPLPEITVQHPSPAEHAVGRILADNLIDDGATLQIGPLYGHSAVLRFLMQKCRVEPLIAVAVVQRPLYLHYFNHSSCKCMARSE